MTALRAREGIPVGAPALVGNEKKYVMDCLETGWISSGPYVKGFEDAFADFCGVKHAVSCASGTAALHLALMALGVEAGDEVIVPTLTYVSTANAGVYCGARPVFVDSEPETWNLDPSLIESRITNRTKGLIAVHLYGYPADMDPILAVARRHGLFVLEDAAQAHGAQYKGRRVGSLGDAAVFSFFGSKILTTGEGGMVVTDDEALARRVRELRGQGMDPSRRYWFPVVGYNYRMTNIAAAIGLAQVEKAAWHLERRRQVAAWYREELRNCPGVTWQSEKEWAVHAYWMFSVLLADSSIERDEAMVDLEKRGVETRPVFYPMHALPPYRDSVGADRYPVAERIARCGLSLPTWGGLTRDEVSCVSRNLRACLRKRKLVESS